MSLNLARRSRLIGFLFLLIFVIGVAIYQFLRGPYVFSDTFQTDVIQRADSINTSVLLAYLSGTLTVLIGILLMPILNRKGRILGWIYLIACLFNFAGIALENLAVQQLVDVAYASVETGENTSATQAYEAHERAHLLYLLLSCLPVGIFFFACLVQRLLPPWLAISGLVAVGIMAVDMSCSLLGHPIPYDLLLPIGLVQLFLPFWLMIKGFRGD